MESSGIRNGQSSAALTQESAATFSGLFSGTGVMTLDGSLSVEYLTPGDRVVTRAGAIELKKVLTGKVCLETCRLAASALGTARPEKDITLPADQKILIRDWRARAIFDQDSAVVPVSRLADGEHILREEASENRLFSLIFETDQICYAGGLEVFCPARPVRPGTFSLI